MTENLAVAGSISFDTIDWPGTRRSAILGGAATYLAFAAALFARPRVISCIGDDFHGRHRAAFERRGAALDDLQRVAGSPCFRWAARYDGASEHPQTLSTELNAIRHFDPSAVRPDSRAFLMVGALPPLTQLALLEAARDVRVSGLDTNEYWIEREPDALRRAAQLADIVLFNEHELSLLTRAAPMRGAMHILEAGAKAVVIKRGRVGATLVTSRRFIEVPACPAVAIDPTGAGDSFDGALFGALARSGCDDIHDGRMLSALAAAAVVASFAVEGFGVERLAELEPRELELRSRAYQSYAGSDTGERMMIVSARSGPTLIAASSTSSSPAIHST